MESQRTGNSGAPYLNRRKDIPDGIWVKCSECGEIIYNGELTRNLRICPRCDYYFPLETAERISLLADRGSFHTHNTDSQLTDRSDEESCVRAIITGEATLSGHRLVMAAANLDFIQIDLNLVPTALSVCEKIVRAAAQAIDQHLPLLLICTDGTGAQNGTFSSAQILSISAAISRLAREKLLYISILAHSNPHGYFPGFAYIADIVIAESNIQGIPRRGAQTNQSSTNQVVQTLFQSGMVDAIASRRELKHTLTDILRFFC